MTHITVLFQNNKYATSLYGTFDENLSYIESKMDVVLRSRGNELFIEGEQAKIERAQKVVNTLYEMIKSGQIITRADVDGVIRMTVSQQHEPLSEARVHESSARISTKKRTIHARTPTQDQYMRALERAEMVFGVGPAGTGKTYLAVAHAAMLLERGIVERIILSRPAVEAGEHLGFLPGDMKEKVDPYLRPLYDALHDMMPADKVDRAIAAGVIEIAPLAFMRGRTLSHAVIILDEAQNTTSMQMKMFLTRLGENGRMIITGDPSQIDLPIGQKSGLVEALEILADVENILKVKFTQKDVVRHPLVAEIVAAYDKRSK